MKKALVLFALLVCATPAVADSQQVLLPGGAFCTFNPGLNQSTVVCDYSLGYVPRRMREVRVRAYFTLGPRGGVKCAVVDTYDPAIGSIRDGRILSSTTRCF